MMVLAPGFHPAGQTTPCSSACWKAWMILIVSSTLRPTCSSLMVIDLILPLPSITKRPLKVAPLSPSEGSSTSTPQLREISLVISAKRGILICPNPPFSLGVFFQAKWEKCESTETAITQAPISTSHKKVLLKSAARSLQLMISVGQTQVKSKGQKRRTTYLDLKSESLSVANELSGRTARAENSGADCLGAIERATASSANTTQRYFMYAIQKQYE